MFVFRRLLCFINSLNETGLNDDSRSFAIDLSVASIFLMEIAPELKFLSKSLKTFGQTVFISSCHHLTTKRLYYYIGLHDEQ